MKPVELGHIDEWMMVSPLRAAPRKHNTNSCSCWCQPENFHPCPECPIEPGNMKPNPSCWRCGGRGLVLCDAPDVEDCDETHVIVHRCDDCLTHPCSCLPSR